MEQQLRRVVVRELGRRPFLVPALLTMFAAMSACDPDSATSSAATPGAGSAVPAVTSRIIASSGNPLAGQTLYVDPLNPVAQQVNEWKLKGRAADAAELAPIAGQPSAYWVTPDLGYVRADTHDYVSRAAQAHQMPVLVAYNIPDRDCGGYSSGGSTGAADYRRWIADLAAGIGDLPATIILEPDAIAHALSDCLDDPSERYALLKEAVMTLKAGLNTVVYLDAGHPRWITDVSKLATALGRSGVGEADGFALNVSNFVTTSDNVDFGRQLSRALGGAHFVIDTSRNGRGPVSAYTINGGPSWCNPPGRALGRNPTTKTDWSEVDALFWVKPPGESDGSCRDGEPAAGAWWAEYALSLVRNRGG